MYKYVKYVCMYVCIYIYTYVRIYIYICIYIYIVCVIFLALVTADFFSCLEILDIRCVLSQKVVDGAGQVHLWPWFCATKNHLSLDTRHTQRYVYIYIYINIYIYICVEHGQTPGSFHTNIVGLHVPCSSHRHLMVQ